MTNTERRATPAEPWPETKDMGDIDPWSSVASGLPSMVSHRVLSEFGPDAVSVLDSVTFMYSDASGDVPKGSMGGLVHADTRLLSEWVLRLNGATLLPLRTGSVAHHTAAFFLTLPGLPSHEFGVRRLRTVDSQLRERIEIWSYAREPETIEVRLTVDNDFADLFEIKEKVFDRSPAITRGMDGPAVVIHYRNNEFEAQTRVQVSPPADSVDGKDLVWKLDLRANSTWTVDITVPLISGPEEVVPVRSGFGEVAGGPADGVTVKWNASFPVMHSDSDVFTHVGRQTAKDLLALRMQTRLDGEKVALLAAGLPWFLTVFGRDSLIAAYQSIGFEHSFARGTLLKLAALQGKDVNDFRDEEPGKILHEIRQGELTKLGLKPHGPYYGSADATMLWLILLSEYWRWTQDMDLVGQLAPNAQAALGWIDQYGDRDKDGYVEYQTRSTQGLGNQCWRDSGEGVQYADGRLPYLPLATCELQGYVYDAKLRMAELADGPFADPALATRLRAEAADLKERFNVDFWIPERGGYYAVGLDGDKKKVDSMTSNMGHLLWSGIVSDDRAESVARQLMSDEMFSGWGVRTLSTHDQGYNPMGYHIGTVWPHENSLIAMGLARYGYREEANRIVLALLDAASFSEYRLPEAFSGYARTMASFPVPYPTACSPQAWATAAPMLLLRIVLGLTASDGTLTMDPCVPEAIGELAVDGLVAFGNRWDVTATGRTGKVAPHAR